MKVGNKVGNFVFTSRHIQSNKHDFPFKIKVVRVKGLEPPRLAAPEPKSGASTNSATPARYTRWILGCAALIAKLVKRCERKSTSNLQMSRFLDARLTLSLITPGKDTPPKAPDREKRRAIVRVDLRRSSRGQTCGHIPHAATPRFQQPALGQSHVPSARQ